MSEKQKWFILIWLAALSTIGAAAMALGSTSDYALTVFVMPLVLLVLWGLAHLMKSDAV